MAIENPETTALYCSTDCALVWTKRRVNSVRGWLVAVLTLFSLTAHTYEADVHYFATFAIARAAGWSEEEALTIASANQGVDENKETAAALEADANAPLGGPYQASPIHQAKKNLQFHCFSNVLDFPPSIAPNVTGTLDSRFSEVEQAGAGTAEQLIKLGVALHCLQDSYSHNGFGGSCRNFDGSCVGHSFHSLMNVALFPVKGEHRLNPDHPSANGSMLQEAVRQTGSKLTTYLRRRGGTHPPVPVEALDQLSQSLSSSGRGLSDSDRMRCNQYLIGHWLIARIHSATEFESVPPGLVSTCASNSTRVVRIPEARYPRLDHEARPSNVSSISSYELVRNGALDLFVPLIEHSQTTHLGSGESTYTFKIQVSGLLQIPAAALVTISVLSSNGNPFGIAVPIQKNGSSSEKLELQLRGPPSTKYVVQAEVGPLDRSIRWPEKNIHNDQLSCAVDEAISPATTFRSELGSTWSAKCSNRYAPPVTVTPNPPTNVTAQ